MTTVAKARGAVESNKNIVNIVVLLPIAGHSESQEKDCVDFTHDVEEIFELAGEIIVEEKNNND